MAYLAYDRGLICPPPSGRDPITPSKANKGHAARYFDRGVMEQEWENLWPKVWLMAGLASDVPEVGDFFKYDFSRESFIIVRSDENTIKAFYNVCPHRGNQLVSEDFGSLDRFTCPFHNWKFGLDGENIEVTDPETFRPEVLCNNLDLAGVRCETLGGIVFVTMNDDMTPLRTWLGPVAEEIERYELQHMRPVRHNISTWYANWKIGYDGFGEAYHVQGIHPQMEGSNDGLRAKIELLDNGMTRQITPWAQPAAFSADQTNLDDNLKAMLGSARIDAETYTGKATDVRRDIQRGKRNLTPAQMGGLDYSKFSDELLSDNLNMDVFPNIGLAFHPETAFIFQFVPHPTDPEMCMLNDITLYRPIPDSDYTPLWMGLPEGTDFSGHTRPEIRRSNPGVGESPGLGLTLDQDASQFPLVQRGQRSRGFRGPLFSEQEVRLSHFHAEYDLYMAGEKG